MPEHQIIAENLKRLIEAAGTNPSNLARRVGLNHTAARDIISGKARNPTHRTLQLLAEGLGVPITDLTLRPPEGLAEAPGNFARSAGQGRRRPSDAEPTDPPRDMIAAVAPAARTPACYVLASSLPGFGMVIGDILILDLARRPQSGDIVIATTADMETGEASTIVRRYLEPYLVAGDPGETEHVLLADGARTAVLAPVEAVVRRSRNAVNDN
jgi:transcriptional regulator with XRE-family HTH domain